MADSVIKNVHPNIRAVDIGGGYYAVASRDAAVLNAVIALLTGIVLAPGGAIIGKVGIDQTTPGTTNRVDAQLSGLSRIESSLFKWTSATWIAAQALTSDGVQWSDEKTQPVGGAETQVFGAIIEPPKIGSLVAVTLGLTCQLKSGEATVAKTWQWKARNKGGTWVALHPAVSENLTTSYVEKYRSGTWFAVTNFNAVPFEVGLFCTPHASTALATIISQVANKSTVVALYKPA